MRLASGNVALTATSRAPIKRLPRGADAVGPGNPGLEFLPEGPTGPDGEPLGGGWRHPLCGGEVQAAFGSLDETLSSETRESRESSSGR
jgi:hypothetical protein